MLIYNIDMNVFSYLVQHFIILVFGALGPILVRLLMILGYCINNTHHVSNIIYFMMCVWARVT